MSTINHYERILNPSDLHYGSVFKRGSGKMDAKKFRDVFRTVTELAQKHKITVLLPNQTAPEDATSFVKGLDNTIVLGRESDRWHKEYFMPNVEQFRFPRSKKKRIQKKWRMNSANWKKKPEMFAFVAKVRRDSECVLRPLDSPEGVHPPFRASYIREAPLLSYWEK